MPLTTLPNAARYIIPDSLTQSTGVVTAILNGVTYNVTLSGLSANTLYYLYLNSGTLSFSTTIPSTFRGSNANAILLGAFYANGNTSVAFGQFVDIEGMPSTPAVQFLPTFSASWGSVGTSNFWWTRLGDKIRIYGKFVPGATTGAAGTFLLSNISIDTTKVNTSAGTGLGVGWIQTSQGTITNAFPGNANGPWPLFLDVAASTTAVYLGHNTSTGNYVKENVSNIIANGYTCDCFWEFPVSGWDNSPLKNL